MDGVLIALEPCVERGVLAQRVDGGAGHEGQRGQARLLRARSTRDMSASIHVVHVAAVSSERFMWSPTSLRMRDSGAAAGGW